MEESLISNAFDNIKSEVIEYDTQFNTKFRRITNTQITTVEISPTGSGKNHFYKDSPNTIMLMPTNAMVIEKNGLVSHTKALEFKTDTKIYRTNWDDIDKTKCDYMTYDKFYGHVVGSGEFIDDMNIIIDEAHLLFASDNERYQELFIALLKRTIQYKELKLISATLRVESLAFFKHTFDINVYQNKHFTPHIHFLRKFPKVEPKERTLMFINSVDKMYQIVEYLQKKYKNIKVMTLSSGDKLPTEEKIEEHNVIISTSVIRQGYSIKNDIHKIIIYNVNNSEGAIGILQYMARPRNQSPEVYVVMASTHFNLSKKPEDKKELDIRETTLDIVKKQSIANSDQMTNYALALCIESWAIKVKQSNIQGNDPVLTNYLFEREMKNIELYIDGGVFMKISIKDFIPKATIDVDAPLNEIEEIKFNKLDITDYTEKLLKLDSIDDKDIVFIVRRKIDEIIENINDSKDIEENDKKRIIEKLVKISKVEPHRDFTMGNVLYQYTDAIIVKQMVDKNTFDRCNWHKLNLEIDVNNQDNYTYRDKVVLESKASRLLKIGDKQEASKITHKFQKKMGKRVKASTAEGVKLMERMYSFDQYRTDEETAEPIKIKAKTSKKTEYVIITSIYTVENRWYFKANH